MKKIRILSITLLLFAIPGIVHAGFCGYLKADTTATLKIGPFVDDADGNTAETALTLSQADIRLCKNAGDFAQKNEATSCTHDELGYYNCPIDATDTNTEGRLKVVVHKAGALLVEQTYMVVNANVYDSLYAVAATDYLQVDNIQVAGTSQTANDNGADINEILTDTGTTLQGELDGIQADTEDLQTQVGTAGAGLTAVPWNASWDAEVESEATDALVANDLDHLIEVTAGVEEPTDGSYLDQVMHKDVSQTFDATTDSLEAIRDRGDAAWTTGAGGSDRLLMVDTTIATLTSQTSFTLTAGSADDNAYNNCTIVIEDAATATQKAVGIISAYTGATKTVTLKYDPVVFTMAASDKVYVLAENALKSTLANRQLNVAADGDIAGNVDGSVASVVGHTPQTADHTAAIADVPTVAEFNARTLLAADYVVTTDTIAGATTVTTLTGHTAQTADHTAAITAIETDTQDLQTQVGTAGAGLTAVPWNAAWDAEVESEATDALVANDLDHLIEVTAGVEEPTDGSYLDQVMHKDVSQTFDATTDSLEAIRDRGDAAWSAAAGNPNVLIDTTIATVTDQTHFTLTAGSDIDSAYLDQAIVLYDASNNDYPSVRKVAAYTGATKTVTLDSAPVFTIIAGDGVKTFVTAPGTTAPTAGQVADAVWDEAQVDHVGAGTFGITASEIADILTDTGTTLDTLINDIPTTAEFNARTLPSADYVVTTDTIAGATTVTTLTGHTAQTADHTAAIADVPTVAEFEARTLPSADYVVTTDTIAGATTVTNLTNAPTSGDLTATMKASVNAEVDTALADVDLDHFIEVTAGVEEPTDGSYLDQIMHKDVSQTFDATTDSLEAIRDTAPLGTAMRGTDNAALASVCTETRLGELDAANLPADLDAVLVDTGTTLQAEVDGIQADTEDLQTQVGTAGAGLTAVPWNAAWDAEVESEATDALTAYDPPTDTEMDTGHAAIIVDTEDIQARIPAALAAGRMSADAAAISGSTEAADKLEASAETIVMAAAVAGTLSTTQMTTTLTEATDDHYNGRIIIWTSGVLIGQATDITDYDGASKMLTFTAVTEAPSADDTFNII